MLNLSDKIQLLELLNKLQADAQPIFGTMTAQHMVEHLALAVRFSNGKMPQQHYYPTDKEQRIKAFVIGTNNELPIGFKAPVLPTETLLPLEYAHLADAIANLMSELQDFAAYFIQHPLAQPINPTMGELNYQEWVIFHQKHFSHHFRQFGLL